MGIYEELVARGLIAQVTNEQEIRDMINAGKATFYIGFDCTADSLTAGHFMALTLMKRLQLAGNKPIALVVEDNHDVATYIEHVLERQFNVVHAYDGREGVTKAHELVPDIIITDLMMPGINGYELCRRIRHDELAGHVPIIVVTARSTRNDRLEALAVGADAFLVKPFNNDELNALAGNLLLNRKMLRMKYQATVADLPAGSEPGHHEEASTATMTTAGLVAQNNRIFIDKVKTILGYLSFRRKYFAITCGLFNVSTIVFYISVAILVNYLTIRVFERRRWS